MKNFKYVFVCTIALSVIISVLTIVKFTFSTGSDYAKYGDLPCVEGGSFSVQFNTVGGNYLTGIVSCITCNDTTLLPVPTKKEVFPTYTMTYEFGGWYYDSAYANKVDATYIKDVFLGSMISYTGNDCEEYQTINLYAKWINPVREDCTPKEKTSNVIIYSSNGGTILENDTYCLTCEETYQKLLKYPTKEGYSFGGWYYDQLLTDPVTAITIDEIDATKQYQIDFNCTNTSNTIILYAKWNEVMCKGVEIVGTINYNTNVAGLTLEPTYATKSCEGYIYSFPELRIPERKNYLFDGWYLDSGLKTLLNNTIEDVSDSLWLYKYNKQVELNTTLYAKWTKSCPSITNTKFNIVYNSNGGSTVTTESLNNIRTEGHDLVTPTKTDYTFVGWYLDSAFTNKAPTNTKDIKSIESKDSDDCLTGYKDITLYAKWQKNEVKCTPLSGGTYKLIYNSNGGTTVDSESVCIGCVASKYHALTKPTRTGYNFVGWYYESTFVTKADDSTQKVKYTKKLDVNGCEVGYNDVTLYAKWDKIPVTISCIPSTNNTFKLIYNTNGGETLESENVCVSCTSESNKTFKTPLKEGYIFEGWFYDNNFIKPVKAKSLLELNKQDKFDENNCIIGYKDITIYAKWREEKYIVLTGILKDSNGNPLANHIVELHSNVLTTTTNEKGEYTFEKATEGNHELYVKDTKGEVINTTNIVLTYNGETNEKENAYSYTEEDAELVLNLALDKNNAINIDNNKTVNINIVDFIPYIIIAIITVLVLSMVFKKKQTV